MPATLSIITNVFPTPRAGPGPSACGPASPALGLAVGPVTGGFLLEHFWWGSVLLVNVPVVIVGPGGRLLPDPRLARPGGARLDVPGAVLSIVGLATLLWGLIEGPTEGLDVGPVLAFVAGLALLAAFLVGAHTDQPMLDLAFFRNPRFSAASAAITLTFMALMGLIFMFTQYLQSVLGYTPLKAGAVLMPMSAVMLVLAPLSARFVERLGTKVVGTGLLIVTLASGACRPRRRVASTPLLASSASSMVLAAGMANVMAPGHRVDHGLAAPGQGRRGLGRQRHHPPGRRRPRRGRARQPHGLRLRRPGRSQPGWRGPDRRRARRHRRQRPGRHRRRERHRGRAWASASSTRRSRPTCPACTWPCWWRRASPPSPPSACSCGCRPGRRPSERPWSTADAADIDHGRRHGPSLRAWPSRRRPGCSPSPRAPDRSPPSPPRPAQGPGAAGDGLVPVWPGGAAPRPGRGVPCPPWLRRTSRSSRPTGGR